MMMNLLTSSKWSTVLVFEAASSSLAKLPSCTPSTFLARTLTLIPLLNAQFGKNIDYFEDLYYFVHCRFLQHDHLIGSDIILRPSQVNISAGYSGSIRITKRKAYGWRKLYAQSQLTRSSHPCPTRRRLISVPPTGRGRALRSTASGIYKLFSILTECFTGSAWWQAQNVRIQGFEDCPYASSSSSHCWSAVRKMVAF
ncbi:hypothetical protein BJY04DRAFT_87031 [Aspergillus karnatakaensis]|uniref:uncharacterized protein n=1 Tax=Aspergillus karnatakaensis TaxID=1810916 RepID=UPI003CCCFC0F